SKLPHSKVPLVSRVLPFPRRTDFGATLVSRVLPYWRGVDAASTFPQAEWISALPSFRRLCDFPTPSTSLSAEAPCLTPHASRLTSQALPWLVVGAFDGVGALGAEACGRMIVFAVIAKEFRGASGAEPPLAELVDKGGC
ncbi:MAG TPA: hypothetical protein PLI09_20960, partial [Candidatus Hydrogenedentes bacterium]|nr:hypothetical protein [Candidatus Hydrogenedentota bacterium]